MRLSDGARGAGVGGGICQLANLLHWMVLHSPLTVVERSEHSFDPFPDNGRVLPWGVGCSIAYNYVDLVVRNDTVDDVPAAHLGRRARTCAASSARTAPLPVSYSRARRARSASSAVDGRAGAPQQRDLADRRDRPAYRRSSSRDRAGRAATARS